MYGVYVTCIVNRTWGTLGLHGEAFVMQFGLGHVHSGIMMTHLMMTEIFFPSLISNTKHSEKF